MRINVEKESVKEWLGALDGAAKQQRYGKLWKRVHSLIAVPSRRRPSVNLYKISRYSKDGDNVIVPGKVLSTGPLTHRVNIAAIEYSSEAMKTLKEANCKILGIKDMLKAEKIHVIV